MGFTVRTSLNENAAELFSQEADLVGSKSPQSFIDVLASSTVLSTPAGIAWAAGMIRLEQAPAASSQRSGITRLSSVKVFGLGAYVSESRR
jgi:hypothetical protein